MVFVQRHLLHPAVSSDMKVNTQVIDHTVAMHVTSKHFAERGNLKKHMFTHTGHRLHKCVVCQT